MGKIEQPPYGTNFMGGHYSSRVQRYSPTSSNLYSQNMLSIFDIEPNNLVNKKYNITNLFDNRKVFKNNIKIQELIPIDTAIEILKIDLLKVEAAPCPSTITLIMLVNLYKVEIQYCPLTDRTAYPEIRVMLKSTNKNNQKSMFLDLRYTKQQLFTTDSKGHTI